VLEPYDVQHPAPYGREPTCTQGLRAVELFAGVGGFRLGLRTAGWCTVWSNQWEPSTKSQPASDCYAARFGNEGHVCQDIAKVLDDVEAGMASIPEHDLVVGGFPCQDYSVAKTLNQARGIQGKKGVLWWEIFRFLQLLSPQRALFENVDRLLKSPAAQRGRDFAIMLASLASLGYAVEWRVVNAADYGLPQKRRRVFIVAHRDGNHSSMQAAPMEWIHRTGVLARALPVTDTPDSAAEAEPDFILDEDIAEVSGHFGLGRKVSPFRDAGLMVGRQVWTLGVVPAKQKSHKTLGDIVLAEEEVPAEFFVKPEQLDSWAYLKGSKSEPRRHKGSGTEYNYSEGALPFPDPLDRPARTILTGEGGMGPSRFKHVVRTPSGRFRRLTPVELERLNGFPDGWTAGMSDIRRAFCMGNALVVGVVERIAGELARDARGQ
jgi:DNA (cytosine-5)-methyltransferase 1